MEFILDTIDSASRQGQCFPAVVTALTVPDIAGAVDSPGAGSQARYVTWIDGWFSPRFPTYIEHHIDGVALYALRCKLLHEGLSDPSQAPAASKSAAASHKRLIAFNVGPNVSMHLCTSSDAAGDSWTILRAETFCSDITSAARDWIATRKSDPAAMQMLKTLVDIRTDVPPLSRGIPLICAGYECQPHATDRSRASLRPAVARSVLQQFPHTGDDGRLCPHLPQRSRQTGLHCACSTLFFEGWLDGLPLHVSNEGLRRPRVARAQEMI